MHDFSRLSLSVVIPAHNGSEKLARCLAAVTGQIGDADELIIVDDGSTEDITRVVTHASAIVLRLEQCRGPAAARNKGAETATRPILVFLDSDVIPHADALDRGRAWMNDAGIDAIIGAYDDDPESRTIVSLFKNIAHHYFHQRAAGPVASFWGACGFVRRDVFQAAGGFDDRRFSRPSIEDVELGWRMADRGARIVLDPAIQVTHLKRWTLRTLITTDVTQRAMPWVRFSLERRRFIGQLNVTTDQRLAAPLALLFVGLGVAAIPLPAARLPFSLVTALSVLINLQLFKMLWRKGGVRLFLGGFVLQQLYYLCALTGSIAGVFQYLRAGRSVAAPEAHADC